MEGKSFLHTESNLWQCSDERPCNVNEIWRFVAMAGEITESGWVWR